MKKKVEDYLSNSKDLFIHHQKDSENPSLLKKYSIFKHK